ncbi:MAG: hypothetical protein MZV70_51505 [Desulfobacterales bacterium]|nr:hypothetical protein [Desulfobacterales bacterium]
MGAFNQWVKGSFLETAGEPPNGHRGHEPALRRRRRHPRQLAARPGVPMPGGAGAIRPMELADIQKRSTRRRDAESRQLNLDILAAIGYKIG